jgi:hypothetical protein
LWLVQPTEAVYSVENVVRYSVHDLAGLAMHQPKETREVGDATRSPHATQESVPLHEEHVGAVSSRGGCGGKTSRTTADDHNVK